MKQMYRKVFTKWSATCLLTLCGICFNLQSQAQFTLTGQLRTRTEIRDGLANLVPNDAKDAQGNTISRIKPGIFTSQRTRINFGYKWDRLTFGVSVQDVRVWGQDASSISNGDGNKLMLHEGWGELTLFNKADTTIKTKLLDLLTLKIGRQELIYDDSRLIGNLDWLQQARRFDMALLKMVHQGYQVDLGYAFNQNGDGFGVTNSAYVPGNIPVYVKNSFGALVPVPAGMVPTAAAGNANNNSLKGGNPLYSNPPSTNGATQDYKSFTSLYISKKFNQTKFSALFFNDNFGKYKIDSSGTATAGYVYGRRFAPSSPADLFDYSPVSRYTYGLMVNHTLGNATGFGKIAIQAAYYAQSGKTRENVDLDAYHYMAFVTYQKGKFAFTPGYEFLSGDNNVTPSATNHRFDPLYGTPHRHWGYMDFFYAGTGSPVGGLKNPYFKAKYISTALTIGADAHLFYLDKDMKGLDGLAVDKKLGTEIDFQLGYTMNKFTALEFGYSLMKATNSMAVAKGQATAATPVESFNKTGKWFYAMIKFTPDFLYTKPVAIKQ